MANSPSPQGISRLLGAAGFDRSEILSQAQWHHRYTAGFYVQGAGAEAHVRWRAKTALVRPSDAQLDRNRATALEMAGKYAEAIRAAGWPAEVIHLAGPVVRVSAKGA